jgi:hypothetical protein
LSNFWVANWLQVTNKCYNVDVRILINAGTLAPTVANWPPKFDGILFSALGPIKCSAFISNLGQIEISFSMSALTPSVKPLGLISTFASI